MKRKAISIAVALLFLAVGAFFFVHFKFAYREVVLLPTDVYEVFSLTDSLVGGSSTSDLSKNDSVVEVNINVRSGEAYPYAGVGVNLLSERNRPAADFFDFSKYDSIAVEVSSGRLRTVEVRLLNNDPVYSTEGMILSYRPQVKIIPANGITKFSLVDLKTPEWWIAAQGLEEDDHLTYLNRGVLLAVVNGEGALRGIPDFIQIKSVKLWGGVEK